MFMCTFLTAGVQKNRRRGRSSSVGCKRRVGPGSLGEDARGWGCQGGCHHARTDERRCGQPSSRRCEKIHRAAESAHGWSVSCIFIFLKKIITRKAREQRDIMRIESEHNSGSSCHTLFRPCPTLFLWIFSCAVACAFPVHTTTHSRYDMPTIWRPVHPGCLPVGGASASGCPRDRVPGAVRYRTKIYQGSTRHRVSVHITRRAS